MNVHQEEATQALRGYDPQALVVLDQGSRAGPALLPGTPTLIIDHHQSLVFPDGAVALSSYGHEPVATSSLLAYLCCCELHKGVKAACAWLAALGTMGDLGTSFKFTAPMPVDELNQAIKAGGGRKAFSTAVSLVNAPRRTAACDSSPAWEALSAAAAARDIDPASRSAVPQAAQLQACRDEVSAAVDGAARAPPRFSTDGRVALVRISSPCQIHPLIVTRWARSLKGKSLQVVVCANDAYLPGRVNFAARIAQQGGGTAALGKDSIDLIALLKEAAGRQEGLREELGEDFARGHAQATGGSVSPQAFERLCAALGLGGAGSGGGASGRGGGGGSAGKRGQPVGKGGDEQVAMGQKRSRTLLQFGFTKQAAAAVET
ncbi:hypothetical protein N2152v2_002870 [Parachlorella kessleri]